jgi:general L-amino acid transport system substrate-binding protein
VGGRGALDGLWSDSGGRERRDQRQRAGDAGKRRPDIKRLLGVEGEMGAKLGLPNDFMVKAIEQVGNYGEIYDRNLGPDTPFNLPRGLNAQWTEGGLLYSPPFR